MERMDLELLEAVQCIQPGIQGQGGAVAAELVAVEEGGVFFLQVSAVGQQDGAQVARARRAMDGVGVAVTRQQGQVAAAWVSTTASIWCGVTGRGCQLRRRSCL